MMVCPQCQILADWSVPQCPHCGFEVELRGGHWVFAPAVADASEGFEPEFFAQLAPLEAANFWFVARNRLILWAFRRFVLEPREYLEIGCGTGFVLEALARAYPRARMVATEVFLAGLEVAAKRVPGAEFVQMDARQIPYREAFDAVGAYDVIEHIAEDEEVLIEIHRALRPGGHLVLTVPQHPWLWSAIDERSHHQRRYEAKVLHQKLHQAGFRVRWSTSFVTILLPLMWLSRFQSRPDSDLQSELKLPVLLNSILGALLALERIWIQWGFRLPVGGSRLVIAEKVCP